MFKILTLNNIAVEGLRRLPRERYEVASEIVIQYAQHEDSGHGCCSRQGRCRN
jgi:hypothetical protein